MNQVTTNMPNPRYSSCGDCRKAKKKCDQGQPRCSLCVKKGRKCEYLLEKDRRPITKNYVVELLKRIDKLEDALKYYKDNEENRLSSSPDSDVFYKDIVNNILNFEKDHSKHPYPLSTSLGFALPTNTLQSCTKYSNHYVLNMKVPLFDNWGFSFAGKGAPLFSGFTSMRFANVKNPPPAIFNTTTSPTTKNLLRETSNNNTLGSYYKEIFDWFFERIDNTIPLINRDLFFSSIESSLDQEALEIGEDQHASISLINSIVAYYFLIKEDDTSNFLYFYNLAQQQVNEETKYIPQLKTVQTLLLLSIIDMTRGNEISASELVARAVAISYHLGLHMDSNCFTDFINEEEATQRELTFWCCFIIDKLRGSVLGISPFVHCPEVSIKLPGGSIDNDILMETITFADTQCETLNVFAFTLRDLFFSQEKDEKTEYVQIGLGVSKASLTMTEWRKNMIKHTLYSNTKTITAAYLEVLYNTSRIVLHKQLIKDPLSLSDGEQMPIVISTNSAEMILKVCEQIDISKSLFGFHFMYTIYIASLIFLFNTSSKDEEIKVIHKAYLQRAVALLESNKLHTPVAEMYLNHLQKFHDEWN